MGRRKVFVATLILPRGILPITRRAGDRVRSNSLRDKVTGGRTLARAERTVSDVLATRWRRGNLRVPGG